jgi:predicted metal-dependent phosphoesterase TrpH
MRIDLHVHTRDRSACGRHNEKRMIEAAIAAGLDGVVFTDHDRLAPPERLAELNAKYAPFRIFGGVEVTVNEGEHVSVFGVHDSSLESHEWDYPDLYRFVREQDGFLVLNHPFRYTDIVRIDIASYTPDAIEVYSYNTPVESEARIRQLAADLDMRLLANSDAHHVKRLGSYYNRFTTSPADERSLIEALRAGLYALSRP